MSDPNSAYGQWMEHDPKVFVSKVYFRLPILTGASIYILNAYKYNFFPKLYLNIAKNHIECGVNFAGWIIEFMWNRSFEENE